MSARGQLASVDAPATATRTATKRQPHTADRILFAAARLFVTAGYGATSTRDIAKEVGITQPGLYRHFDSKDAILSEICRRASKRPNEVARAIDHPDIPAAVALYRFMYETCMSDATHSQIIGCALRTPELSHPNFEQWRRVNETANRFVRRLVRRGIDEGDLRPIPLRSASRILMGLIESLTRPSEGDPTDVDAEAIVEFAFAGLLRNRSSMARVRAEALAIDVPSPT